MNTKQVIVIRKDLNMRKGKIAAQASHASMAVLLDLISNNHLGWHPSVDRWIMDHHMHGSPVVHWLENSFTKICVSVDSEEELLAIYDKCNSEKRVPCSLITDNGTTEFDGVPTITCCAIGPWVSEEIDQYTSGLKLL